MYQKKVAKTVRKSKNRFWIQKIVCRTVAG